MSSHFAAWSLEPVASEREFLFRELGIAWECTTPEAIASSATSAQPVLLGVSEPHAYQELLKQLPPQSVVMLLLSDEDYSLDRLDLICGHPSVKSVYRHYSLQPASNLMIAREVSRFISGAPSAHVPRRLFVELLRTGRQTRGRMRQWRTLTVPVHEVPLGYTNAFAHEYAQHFGLAPEESLFSYAHQAESARAPQRPHAIFFRGALGQPQRRVMLAAAEGSPGARIELIDNTWQDTQQSNSEYLDGLLSSTQALCPPGWVNTETFRYYEAILCGALPIEPATALTHLGMAPHRGPRPVERVQLALTSIHGSLRTDLEAAS